MTDTAPLDLADQFPHLATDVVVVDDYDEIQELLAHPATVQAAYGGESAELMHGVVNNLDGAEHLQRRRTMAQLLSRSALAEHREETLVECVDQALREVGAYGEAPVRTDLVPLVWRLLHRLAARIAGIDGLEQPEAADRFIDLVRDFGASLTVEWSLDEDKAALRERGVAARAAIGVEFFGPSLAVRRREVDRFRDGSATRADLRRDLVTMLELHREPDWDEDLPLREVCVFLMAATQTTSHAFPRLVVQLEEWLAAEEAPREELLADDDVLRGAVFETLRTFVASPARLRRLTEDVTLASGRRLGEGTVVALFFRPASEVHAGFGVDPERFDPRRRPTSAAPWGLAFGGGAHTCIGRPLILGSKGEGYRDGTLLTLARMLYGAGLRLDPDRPPRSDDTTLYDLLVEVPVVLGGTRRSG